MQESMTSTDSALGNSSSYVIGLDFGTESARGVLLDAHSGMQIKHSEHAYSHGVITKKLPSGVTLPSGWALQNADDYLEAAQRILKSLGQGRRILSIGLDFTASSPMPTTSDLSCTDLVCHFVDDLLGVGGDLGLSDEVLSGDVDGDLLQRA